jgi:hypothetical protein
MSDPQHHSQMNLEFGREIEVIESGFSFHPIVVFELEIDGHVYMYSEGGNLEIYMIGGVLEDQTSIAELNDELTDECMVNVGEFDVFEAGTDAIQGITGFLNEIRFSNAEEEGRGYALICSPYLNQFFFILVIANTEFWQTQGAEVFSHLKSQISFNRLPSRKIDEKVIDKHPDLTIETYETIQPGDDFFLTIERGDVSLLLAARSLTVDEEILITRIIAPGEKPLYQFDPDTKVLSSSITEYTLTSDNGEVVFYYPRSSLQQLTPGRYQFNFRTGSGKSIDEIQIVIRSGRALETQKIDFNLWYALDDAHLPDSEAQVQFEAALSQTLKDKLAPLSIMPGKIAGFHPAPDELESFMSIDVDTDLADCSYLIADTISNSRAINIGFVEQITKTTGETTELVDAISSGSPGMLMTAGSPHACIMVRWTAYQDQLERLVEEILQQVIVFCGIELRDIETSAEGAAPLLNKEIAWRLRRHPVFFEAD